jgi:hypothetical protein
MEAFMKVTRKGSSNIDRTLLTLPDTLYDQQRMNNSKGPTYKVWFRFMELNVTFNNISSGLQAENYRPVTVSSTDRY